MYSRGGVVGTGVVDRWIEVELMRLMGVGWGLCILSLGVEGGMIVWALQY